MSQYDLQKAQQHFQSRLAFTTGVHELQVMTEQGQTDLSVLDVRYPRDYAQGHVPGAVNLPKDKWQQPAGLRKDGVHYLYCYDATCHLAVEAAAELTRQGFHVVEVEGGWERWVEKGFRSEPTLQAA